MSYLILQRKVIKKHCPLVSKLCFRMHAQTLCVFSLTSYHTRLEASKVVIPKWNLGTRCCAVMLNLFIIFVLSIFTLAKANVPIANVYLPPIKTTSIVPEPQEVNTLSGTYTVGKNMVLNLQQPTQALENLASTLQEELAQKWQVELTVKNNSDLAAINVSLLNQQSRSFLADLGIEPVTESEGYVLHIDKDITIVGSDERGAFYGLQSLRQLLRGRPELQAMTVRDYPDFPLRVAMIYLDSNSDELNPQLIPLLAEHKFNAVLVMSNYIRWDSAPELHLPGSASKESAKHLVELSKLNLLNPIPLLETLGHVQWMFVNNQHRDLLADPTVAESFAYDPLNPNVYELLMPIIDEIIEIFEPEVLHIGHDEVRNVIPFPGNEAGRQVGFPKLFLDDTLKFYNYLAKRNIRVMMWHDVLLSDEIIPILSEFPKDIMVASWHYEPATAYSSLERLQAEGFQVLGATWFKPDNITSYAQFAKQKQASGMIQTRWTGYFGNSSLLMGQYNQAYAYLSAANVFWNADALPLNNTPKYFRDVWFSQTLPPQRSGILVDLNPYANRSIDALQSEEVLKGWLGRGENYDMSALLKEKRLEGFKFLLDKAVSLKGLHRRVNTDPERVIIPLNIKANSLVFLHTTGWAAADTGDEVGSYTINFADGSISTIPLLYGQNISAWTESEVSSISLHKAWKGETRNGLDISADLLLWDNPKANQVILSIEFLSTGSIANPILLGISTLD